MSCGAAFAAICVFDGTGACLSALWGGIRAYRARHMNILKEKKIIVLCPGEFASGGPELLHQLVRTLRDTGRDARICYYPLERKFECLPVYRHYDVPQGDLEDSEDVAVIVPEVATCFLRDIRKAARAVWWLSVDNYFGINREAAWKDFIKRALSLARGRRLPLFMMRNDCHLVQSDYAAAFLRRHGLPSLPLSDYLGPEHFRAGPACEREDMILFNPRKGRRRTARLMKAYPEFQFVPLTGMSADQIAALCSRAKIYIDFGHHPGKDRMPREAAVAGCCVITGRHGAAAFPGDVPIPDLYKLDDRRRLYISAFGPLVREVFQNYDRHKDAFAGYRRHIAAEQAAFRAQVEAIF